MLTTTDNLGPLAAPLFGREADIEQVLSRLTQGRLVTLTGPAGVGKTSLAQAVARRLLGQLPNGVWFVSADQVPEAKLLPALIARVLQLRERGETSQVLQHHLAERELVLVLDHLEHLEGVAEVVLQLLQQASSLRLLVTSRQPLRLRDEWRYPVRPLSAGGDLGPAVQLFAQYATAVNPDFVLGEHLPAVLQLCQRLDGLPLALELMASRADVLAPGRMLQQLAPPSASRQSGGPERQRALASVTEWGFAHLSTAERDLFVALAVFTGPFSLAAAETICGTDQAALLALTERSLLRLLPERASPHFALLESLRPFAWEHFQDQPNHHTICARHARFFAALAATAAHELRGAARRRGLEQFEANAANIGAALVWLAQHAELECMQLSYALWWYWTARGRFAEAALWFERILPFLQDQVVRASLQAATGYFLAVTGQGGRALEYLTSAIVVLRSLHAEQRLVEHSLAEALLAFGSVLMAQDRPEALATLEEALALWRKVMTSANDRAWLPMMLNQCAMANHFANQIERALLLLHEAEAVARAEGNLTTLATTLSYLGGVWLHQAEAKASQRTAAPASQHQAPKLATPAEHPAIFPKASSVLLEAFGLAAQAENPGLQSLVVTYLAGFERLRQHPAHLITLLAFAGKLRRCERGMVALHELQEETQRLEWARQHISPAEAGMAWEQGEVLDQGDFAAWYRQWLDLPANGLPPQS
jgi:predicted ATPase